jgi:CRISPR/Cas system CSM-associated protein Csm2 small subunit
MKPMTEAQRQRALKQAQDMMELLDPVFERGDIDEEQFKQAVKLYSQAVIVRARITSMQTNHGETP